MKIGVDVDVADYRKILDSSIIFDQKCIKFHQKCIQFHFKKIKYHLKIHQFFFFSKKKIKYHLKNVWNFIFFSEIYQNCRKRHQNYSIMHQNCVKSHQRASKIYKNTLTLLKMHQKMHLFSWKNITFHQKCMKNNKKTFSDRISLNSSKWGGVDGAEIQVEFDRRKTGGRRILVASYLMDERH